MIHDLNFFHKHNNFLYKKQWKHVCACVVSFSWPAGSEICFFVFFNINHFLSSLLSLFTSILDYEFHHEKGTCNDTTIDLEITFSTSPFLFFPTLSSSLSSNFSFSTVPSEPTLRTSSFSCWAALAFYHYNYKFSLGISLLGFAKN